MDQIRGLVQSSGWALELNMKHLKKAEGRIGQNVGNIAMKKTVQIR